MSSKTAVLTSKAPKPLPGIYSQAIVANGFVYCSGAIAMDAETGKLIDGDITAHTVCNSFLLIIFRAVENIDLVSSTNASKISLLSSRKRARRSTKSSRSMCFWLAWMIL